MISISINGHPMAGTTGDSLTVNVGEIHRIYGKYWHELGNPSWEEILSSRKWSLNIDGDVMIINQPKSWFYTISK